jgi:YbbR domain-containing protein
MRGSWVFRNFGLKLFSVAIALLLWMAIPGEETVERGLRVPLELQQFPAGVEIRGDAPSTVDVRVRGSSAVLSRLSPGEIVAVLDLRGTRAGRRLLSITPEQVRAPFGVDVVQVTPSTVTLTFENTATAQLPVVPSVEGKPAPGFVTRHVSVTPATVEVAGPESLIKEATVVMTEPVSVEGADEDVQEMVTLGIADPALRLKGQRTASVTVTIVPAPDERTLSSLPVHLRNLRANWSAQAIPPSVDVVLRGTRDALAGLQPDDVRAYVDVAGLGIGEYDLSVRADVPSTDAGVTALHPSTVHVRIASAKD